VRLILRSQKVIAIQSRLDICAVRYATSRERFFRGITLSNKVVHASMIATSIARGLMLIPVVGEVAMVGQQLGKATNQVSGNWQLAQLGLQQLADAKHSLCEVSPYSEERIFCFGSHPVIAGSLKRGKAFFPDLFARFHYRKENLGSVTCMLASNPMFYTKLKLQGDTELQLDNYADTYAH
jgi:hypothetical protein